MLVDEEEVSPSDDEDTPEGSDITQNFSAPVENVAGRDIIIIDGVDPKEHAKALAKIKILEEKLAIVEDAKDNPTNEETQAAGEANEAAEELKELGAKIESMEPWNLLLLSKAARIAGSYESAISYNKMALHKFELRKNSNGITATYLNLCSSYFRLGDFPKAKKYTKKSLQSSKESNDFKGTIKALSNLATIESTLGNNKLAFELYQEILDKQQKNNHLSDIPTTLSNMGTIAANLDLYGEAERLYEESLRIAEQVSDIEGVAIAHGNLAALYIGLNQFEKANSSVMKGLKHAKEHKLRVIENLLNGNMANILVGQREYEQAKELTQKCLKYEKEHGLKEDECQSLILLGKVEAILGNMKEANLNYSKSLQIARDLGLRNIQSVILNNLAMTLEDGPEKEAMLVAAINHADELGNISNQLNPIRNLCKMGIIMAMEGKSHSEKTFEFNEEQLQNGLRMSEEIQHPSNIALFHYELGILAGARGDYAKWQLKDEEIALEQYKIAANHLNMALSKYNEIGDEKGVGMVREAQKHLPTVEEG